MGYSQAQKAENRERILALAAAKIREDGIDALAIGPLMEAAQLTHGGFYGHFASRDALVTAAIERALADGSTKAHARSADTIADIARSYLSRRHRDTPSEGCGIAAMAGETARADTDSRAAMARHIAAFADGLRPHVADDDDAMLAVSALVGALIIARVLPDAAASDRWLKGVQTATARLQD